ncbi:hydroxymethylglutaryl-CoA lyase [Nocardioides sp. GXQ0305]|uniref:hydroxymethylglutaryl-CoA lyase n=1 Tax=Nocardioides sp. GXQ0305 TaxID=3423912 RepID=UPI003D7E3E1E
MTGVQVVEVGPRDGLQNEPEHLSPAVRAELVRRLAATGLTRIEVGSFVNPTRVPQMAGTEEVVADSDVPGVTRSALVLNPRGYERLRDHPVPEVHLALCVTETFNQRNQGRSVEQSLAEVNDLVRAAHVDGRRVTVTLAASFGCPFEGKVDPEVPLDLAHRLEAPDEVLFADTIGVGVPSQVHALLRGSQDLGIPLGLHLHNTRNTGYANAYAALEDGVAVLDASVAGLGGCPFAPNATGNVATEDLLYLLEREGVSTGVDLDRLLEVSQWVTDLLGRELPGQLLRAGIAP